MDNSSDKKKQPKVTMLQRKLVDMSAIADLFYTFEAVSREVEKMVKENGEDHKIGFKATAFLEMTNAWAKTLESAIKDDASKS